MRPPAVRTTLLILSAVYWVAMFVGTHVPRVPQVLAEQGDKTLHVYAFAGLAALLLGWYASRRPVTLATVAWIWLLAAGYGAFDEITQPLAGRICDLEDWIADAIGAAVALAVLWPLAPMFRRWIGADTGGAW